MFVFSIRDVKADTFGRPFFSHNSDTAKRVFGDEVNRPDPENPLNQHPEDYSLYEIGMFYDNTGRLGEYEQPKHLVSAISVKRPYIKGVTDVPE
jgi:hypothetical protein